MYTLTFHCLLYTSTQYCTPWPFIFAAQENNIVHPNLLHCTHWPFIICCTRVHILYSCVLNNFCIPGWRTRWTHARWWFPCPCTPGQAWSCWGSPPSWWSPGWRSWCPAGGGRAGREEEGHGAGGSQDPQGRDASHHLDQTPSDPVLGISESPKIFNLSLYFFHFYHLTWGSWTISYSKLYLVWFY